MNKPKQERVTISLTPLVAQWADEMCAAKGYDNFSAYVADLIRRDKERHEEKQRGATYPENPGFGALLVAETPEPPKPKKPKKAA